MASSKKKFDKFLASSLKPGIKGFWITSEALGYFVSPSVETDFCTAQLLKIPISVTFKVCRKSWDDDTFLWDLTGGVSFMVIVYHTKNKSQNKNTLVRRCFCKNHFGEEKTSISEKSSNVDPVDLELQEKKKSMHTANDMCTIVVTVMQADRLVMKNTYEKKHLQRV